MVDKETEALAQRAADEILGAPRESSVSTFIDLYDDEVLKVEGILNILSAKAGSSAYLEGFRQEIVERFGLAGLAVNVKVYEGMGGAWFSFMIEITGRVDATKFEFDHDRQVHEVTNDILGLGTGGTIKTDGLITG